MSGIRTARTSRTRLLAAVATAALAALTLTACNDDAADAGGKGTSANSPAPTAPPAASAPAPAAPAPAPATGAPAATGATGAPAQSGSPASAKPSAKAPAAPKPPSAADGKAVTCEGSVTKTVAAPLTRPVNHLLLTVTNTGSAPCYLYGYPAVRFGEAQSVPPVIEDSKPQAVVTLKPGESGYASVSLSAADGSGAHGHTETSLAVYFHGPSGNESVGAGSNPSLPAKGLYIDDSLKVSYWQQSMDDAVTS
ncbi:DUF4232 domain-containing protein [Kitasatospora sp. NPDC057512]|uniref:DUF4232 domain-containing protein n=1 Tax=Kitasatospora sp. NPDC057512 TaxID=3346154 RepID=UPI0036BC3C5F